MMKINYLNFIFGYIFNLFNEMKTNLNIITKGFIQILLKWNVSDLNQYNKY